VSEDENMIADATARIFADLADPQSINAARNDGWRAPLWQALEDTGLTRAWLSEAAGGAGASLAEGFEILRISGQYAAPVAIAETLVAGWALAQAGLDLPGGVLSLAPMRGRDRVRISRDGAGTGTVTGTARSVAHGAEAGHVVVVHEDRLALMRPDSFAAMPRPTDMGGDRADLQFEGAVPAVLAELPRGADQVEQVGAVARACQITGALETILKITTDYTSERVAFGRPIGKFQAVQQNLAMLAGEVAAAMTSSGSAAATLSEGHCAEEGILLEVAAAKIRVGEAAGTGGAIAHQAMGAIGWTQEHVLQRYTRRIWGWRDDFGTEADWAVRLGSHVAGHGGEHLWRMLPALP